MQKVFYISKNAERYENSGDTSAPDINRFRRVEQLNELLAHGWEIKEFKTDGGEAFFILEKPDN